MKCGRSWGSRLSRYSTHRAARSRAALHRPAPSGHLQMKEMNLLMVDQPHEAVLAVQQHVSGSLQDFNVQSASMQWHIQGRTRPWKPRTPPAAMPRRLHRHATRMACRAISPLFAHCAWHACTCIRSRVLSFSCRSHAVTSYIDIIYRHTPVMITGSTPLADLHLAMQPPVGALASASHSSPACHGLPGIPSTVCCKPATKIDRQQQNTSMPRSLWRGTPTHIAPTYTYRVPEVLGAPSV
jgi:hypothetical protein